MSTSSTTLFIGTPQSLFFSIFFIYFPFQLSFVTIFKETDINVIQTKQKISKTKAVTSHLKFSFVPCSIKLFNECFYCQFTNSHFAFYIFCHPSHSCLITLLLCRIFPLKYLYISLLTFLSTSCFIFLHVYFIFLLSFMFSSFLIITVF